MKNKILLGVNSSSLKLWGLVLIYFSSATFMPYLYLGLGLEGPVLFALKSSIDILLIYLILYYCKKEGVILLKKTKKNGGIFYCLF